MENNTGILQNLILENREKLSISGVSDVLSFDDQIIIIETDLGLLTIKGENIRINKLSIDTSEVIIEGKDATCTETGLTAGKYCSSCNEVLVAQKTIAATGHHFELDLDNGASRYICADCVDDRRRRIADGYMEIQRHVDRDCVFWYCYRRESWQMHYYCIYHAGRHDIHRRRRIHGYSRE